MTLIRELGSLESAGLIRVAQAEPDLEYLFRHILVQDAAYASLLEEDRKRLHLLVGETIEELYPQRRQEFAPRLALHFDEAGICDKASQYYRVAGEEALASYASREAEAYLRSAIRIQPSDLDQADTLKNLGLALYQQGRLTEASAAMEQAIAISKEVGPAGTDLTANLYSRAARFAWTAGDTPGGLRICEEGMAFLKDEEETKGFAMLLHETARAYHFNGVPEKALPLCKRAITLAEKLGAKGVLADALATYGILPSPPAEEKFEALNRAVEIAEANGILHVAHRAHHNLGVMCSVLSGDDRKAYEHYMRAAEISKERGVEEEVLYSLSQANFIKLNFGEIRDLEQVLPEFETRIKRLSEKKIAELNLLGLKAGLEMGKGSWKQALEYLEPALEEARQQGDLQFLRSFLFTKGWIHVELGRWEGEAVPADVIPQVEEAIQLGKQQWGDSVEGRALLTELFTLVGDLERAHGCLERGRKAFANGANLADLATLDTAAGILAKVEGRWEEAFKFFEAAVATRVKLGHKLLWARVLSEWGEAHCSRAEQGDLQRAQALLRESHQLLVEAGSPGYLKLSESRLNEIRSLLAQQAEAGAQAVEDIARARSVQQSFLPEAIPDLPGVEISAALLPARQISGDFYDFIHLPDGLLGIVIADVADKGPAAALYMTSSRTLIRTYASQFPHAPERVMGAVNERILGETHAGLFVSVFYGVLNPLSKRICYCNAGHNPPLWIREDGSHQRLTRTGVPLGIYEQVEFESAEIEVQPEDLLVLYTDGVTDGQNKKGDFYGMARVLTAAVEAREGSAADIHATIMGDLQNFSEGSPQFDDITLLVLKCAGEAN